RQASKAGMRTRQPQAPAGWGLPISDCLTTMRWTVRMKLRRNVGALIILISVAGSTVAAAGQKLSSDDCLGCHGDSSLTTDENGKPVSLYVNAEAFHKSIHGGMFSCVDCHTDVKSIP